MSKRSLQPQPLQPEVLKVKRLSGIGVDEEEWLHGAEHAVDFVQDNSTAERVIIYASAPHVLVHGVLAPLKNLNPPDQKDLRRNFPTTDRGWTIQHAYGGGQGHRVWLEDPLANAGKTFKGGEKLVYWRSWAGRDCNPIEISQKFAHALDIHYVAERNAYCRLDELGDPVDVVSIYQEPGDDSRFGTAVVSVLADDLWEYARLAGCGIVFFFDFTRYNPGFPGWSNLSRSECTDEDLFYKCAIDNGVGSFCRGRFIARPQISKREVVRRRKEVLKPKRQYATFKAIDLRTGDRIEASSDPAKMASYFDKSSTLPLEMSPVFFKPEVLYRYKANPAKYVLTDRNISCRGAWHLETYDINSVGQVHTYLRYLGYLPHQEQLYWASMNEWPKASISRRAYQTDFKGEYATDYDPLIAVKQKVERLDKLAPKWWNPRGRAAADTVHYPAGNSDVDWASELLRLDQLVVEGFLLKPLKEIVVGMGRRFEPEWQSLVALREILLGKGVDPPVATAAYESLRTLRSLRTNTMGHAIPGKRQEAVRTAKDHGGFRAHFAMVAADVDAALELVIGVLLPDDSDDE